MTPGRAIYEYRRPGDPAPRIPWEELAAAARDFFEEQFAAGLEAYSALPARRPQAPGSVPWQAVNAVCLAAGLDPEQARAVLEAAAPHMQACRG